MGQKINPIGYRLGPLYTWSSRWYADKKNYQRFLLEDVKIRKILMSRLRVAQISRVEIERSINTLELTLHVGRPGLVIGRGGSGMEDLKKYLIQNLFGRSIKNLPKIDIKVESVKEPNLDAYLVANTIADQLGKRFPAKRAMNQAVDKIVQAGAKGARIILSGRIGGAEIARRERIQTGVIPLTTIREKIDFAKVAAMTKSGYIGVKVWICKK